MKYSGYRKLQLQLTFLALVPDTASIQIHQSGNAALRDTYI